MAASSTTPVGLVLAGGAGRRMGRPKGSLQLGDRSLALIAADRLQRLCGSVCISIAAGAENPAPGYPAIEDAPGEGKGPLAGIAAAFEVVEDRDLLVLACDYPRVSVELLRSIVAQGERSGQLTIASGERDHPLVAFWHRSTRLPVLEAVQAGALRVLDLVAALPVSRVIGAGPARAGHERELLNVNRPQDLARLALDSGE